jgi:serine/threonine protein kinase
LYLARDHQDEKVFLIALKSLGYSDRGGPSDLTVRFQERLRALSQPIDSYIAKVKHLGQSADGLPFAVLKYIQGPTLAEKINDWQKSGAQPFPRDVLEMAQSLAKTLSAAKVHGLVHTDLRPESIVINENNVPVIIDLGDPHIPELVQDSEQGTVLDYQSPEQQAGHKISSRSNIYSLGVILYEMFAGGRPQLSQFDWDIFDRDTTPKEIPLNDIRLDLKPETYELVSNCISRQEWSRYDSYEDFEQAITVAIQAEEMGDAGNGRSFQIPSKLLVGVPLILSLVILGVFFVSKARTTEKVQLAIPETAVPGTAIPTRVTSVPGNTSITNGKPAPTQTITAIYLLAPSPGFEFLGTDIVLFDWYWPLPLTSTQHFVLYLLSGTEEWKFAMAEDAHGGPQYQFTLNLAEGNWRTGEYEWYVNLVDSVNGEIVLGSEHQVFSLKSVTEFVSPTMSPSSLPNSDGLPTLTRVVICSPSPPADWVIYSVQASDYLFNLAIATGTTVERIQEVNCLETVTLSIGMSLWLPILPSTATPTPTQPIITTPDDDTQPQSTSSNKDQPTITAVPTEPVPSRTPPPLPTNLPFTNK